MRDSWEAATLRRRMGTSKLAEVSDPQETVNRRRSGTFFGGDRQLENGTLVFPNRYFL